LALAHISSSFFFFFSSRILSGRRFDVYHTSTHDVTLVRIYNAGLKCAARQKFAKNLPSTHHRTTLSGYIFATKACIDSWKNISPEYGELRSIKVWDRLASLAHPSKFQRVSRLGVVTAPTSLNGYQANFARCSAVSWAGTLYIHFEGSCFLTEYCQVQNFTLRPINAFSYIGRVNARHSSSGRQPNCGVQQGASPIFGRAAITLSIGPNSSYYYFTVWYVLIRFVHICVEFYIYSPALLSDLSNKDGHYSTARRHVGQLCVTRCLSPLTCCKFYIHFTYESETGDCPVSKTDLYLHV